MSSTEQSAPRPLPGFEDAQSGAAGLLQEFTALLLQIGSPEGLTGRAFATRVSDVHKLADFVGVGDFLETYEQQLLVPLELPTIVRACGFARSGQSREMIALDREMYLKPLPAPFASASLRAGRRQLERLRPLRDDRVVQRYIRAVDGGEAEGWHTIVYGLTLAVYSWPLRQGLIVYAQQTLSGLARVAASSRSNSEPFRGEIPQTLLDRLPQAVDRSIGEFNIR